ncbi:hypothetical protein [Filimonas effusa]|uniref:Uncharacterized protein n=1 Tax=Filimonas effusa TaxID=2508721 RepID=A0A4Q1D4T9_9BACT|nr:hypothetical protein [Filimonas effusa]RXK83475.1 hypothetical protein ESB13_15385 [Filimonas effusa]
MMKTKNNKIDRGALLSSAVTATGINKEDIARRAGYSRAGYYKHIKDPNLPYHILMAYGKVINRDFTDEFPDMPKYLFDSINAKQPTLTEALQQIENWKMKYLDLLEKYNRIIEDRLNSGK